jgi:enoyl-CoA hydratase
MEPDDPTADGEVLLSERIGHVRVLTLNRPRARNALNPDLKDAILQAMAEADGDPDVRAVVITGNGPVFCAGMDLKAFAGGAAFGGLADFYQTGIGKPLIAALNGPALGGGTTVATRIPLAVALELGLTGEPITAARAERLGLVNMVVPADEVRKEAVAVAEKLAANGPLAVALTKKLIRERRPPAWTGK